MICDVVNGSNKQEVLMYDPNLQLREHAYLKDSKPTAWQDMVRQNRDSDVDLQAYKVYHENWLFLLVTSLVSGLGHLLSSLLHRSASRSRHRPGGVSFEEHSHADR